MEELKRYFELIALSENLKTELRHSWLSNGRQESVAEHSWRLSLMVILFYRHLDKPVNVETCLKMAIVHDLVEAEAGDVPTFASEEERKEKVIREERAILNIKQALRNETGNEIFELWHELERRESYEAKFVNALDKLEVLIQHNEADIETWIPWEYDSGRGGAYTHCEFDSFLQKVSQQIQEDSKAKIASAKELAEV